MHTTLDGFVAGPNGEMDWIKFDDTMFDFVGNFTNEADSALYGRVTYQMMDSYWPTAGQQPNASKHDIEHSRWYNKVDKIVLSKTMHHNKKERTTFIGENISNEITTLKQQPGKNILIFGSPTAVHSLMKDSLIDEYWLFINPIILGKGISLFTGLKENISLKKMTVKEFSCGVVALNYKVEK